jgi:hypothetical protein
VPLRESGAHVAHRPREGPLHFHITPDRTELVDPQDVRSFSAVCAPDLTHDELAQRVRDDGLGELLPGGTHLMVPVETVRRMAEGQVGPGWPDDLAAMVDYAAGEGWTDRDGTRVRAHIERPPIERDRHLPRTP